MDLAAWVEGHADDITDRWLAYVAGRSGPWPPELGSLMVRFLNLMVSLVPPHLGPYRIQIEGLWLQSAELFGSVAAMRARAAGDVIEEFAFLREILIRLLYADPPDGGDGPLGLREVLRLNRIVDQGVTQASVGHTDALFFALIEGSGLPQTLQPEILEELDEQLTAIEAERDQILTGTAGA